MEKTCQYCNRKYSAPASTKPKYCSSKCAGMAKRTGRYVPCKLCGEPVWENKCLPRLYCSRSCATRARNLSDSNPSYHRDISGDKNPMWGKEGLRGEKNPMWNMRGPLCHRWKGGRRVRPDGYARVIAPADHPYPSETHHNGVKYILEHRLVMEGMIGRYLLPGEVVHHLDNNPRNNDPSNLALCASQSDHIARFHPAQRTSRSRTEPTP